MERKLADLDSQADLENQAKEAGMKAEIVFHNSRLQSNTKSENDTKERLKKTLQSRTSSKITSAASQVSSVEPPCNQESQPITAAASKLVSQPSAQPEELKTGLTVTQLSQPDIIDSLQKSELQASQPISVAVSKIISHPSPESANVNLQIFVKNNSGKIPKSKGKVTVKKATSPNTATKPHKTNSKATPKLSQNNINITSKTSNPKSTAQIPQDNSNLSLAPKASTTSSSPLSKTSTKGKKRRKGPIKTEEGKRIEAANQSMYPRPTKTSTAQFELFKAELKAKCEIENRLSEMDSSTTSAETKAPEKFTDKGIYIETSNQALSSCSNVPSSSNPPRPVMSPKPHLTPKASTISYSSLSKTSMKSKKSRKQTDTGGTSKSKYVIKSVVTQEGQLPETAAPGNGTAAVKAMNCWSRKKSGESLKSTKSDPAKSDPTKSDPTKADPAPPPEPNDVTSTRNDGNFFVDLMEGVDRFNDCVIC